MLTSSLSGPRLLIAASLWLLAAACPAQAAEDGKTAVGGPWYSQQYPASSLDFSDSSAGTALLAIPSLPGWSAYVSQQNGYPAPALRQTNNVEGYEASLIAGLRYQWTPSLRVQSQLRQDLLTDMGQRQLELASVWSLYPTLSFQATYGTPINTLNHAFSLGASYRF